jgi:hypothetical protein
MEARGRAGAVRGQGECAINTPVALFIHKRPETTRRVFQEIEKAKPRRLFIIADGPRERDGSEARLCAEARDIVSGINWDCEVRRDFAETKLGLKRRISSGIDWLFSLVEEAIILEDDCLPHPDFFVFCEALLKRFRYDDRVMMISGDNFQGARRGDASYYFSRIARIWGWATWRRAWRRYDNDMASLPSFIGNRRIEAILRDPDMREHYLDLLQSSFENRIDNWGYRWQFALWAHDGLVARPNANLVSNIGFGPGATHTLTPHPLFADRDAVPLGPVSHPTEIRPDEEADLREFRAEQAWYHRPLRRRIWDRLARQLHLSWHRPRP